MVAMTSSLLRPDQPLRLVDTYSPSPARQAIIRVEDLSIVFDAPGGEVIAVDRVSLAVAQGEFVSIVGPSGCGKSTLLNAMAGLERP
ncbi:MAG: ATP-binding cassette domain-containing protein, partial [Bradyrhizobium guangdongense]